MSDNQQRRPPVKGLPNVVWSENSRALYDAAVAATPRLFRSRTEKRLKQAIAASYGPIREQTILDAVREITPKPFLKLALQQLKPHCTDARTGDDRESN